MVNNVIMMSSILAVLDDATTQFKHIHFRSKFLHVFDVHDQNKF